MRPYIALCILSALFGLVASQELIMFIGKVASECVKEAGANMNDFSDILSGKVSTDEADPSLKCVAKCFNEKIGYITPSGEYSPETVRATLGPYRPMEDIDRVINACKDIKGSDPCDFAIRIAHCMNVNRVPH